jgi:hypothetical protein
MNDLGRGYWLVPVGLLVLGFVAAFSIGPAFDLIALTLVVLGPVRRHAVLFWPPLTGVLVFIVGFACVAPLYCSTTSDMSGLETASCASLLGITYPGLSAPTQPGIDAGLLLGLVAAVAVAVLIWVRGSHGRGRDRLRRASDPTKEPPWSA